MSKSEDRPPNLQELRSIFIPGDVRFKFLVSAMASGGFRVGAWDYFRFKDLKIIQVEDQSLKLNPKKIEIGLLKVYFGEPESYECFVSSECVQLFREYVKERIRTGEKARIVDGETTLLPDAPLLAHLVSFESKNPKRELTCSDSVRSQMTYSWKKAGFWEDKEFKGCHGTRKFFKTQLEQFGLKSIVVERLLGHSQGLDSNYYRPTNDQLA